MSSGSGFIKFLRVVLWLPFHSIVRVKVTGKENIPDEGGLIVASNHVTAIDPVFLEFGITKRRIHWMAKAELFKYKPLAWLFRSIGAIPVKRGKADIGATKEFVDVIKNGETGGIFPQGTRSKDFTNPKPAHTGVIRFALEADTKILPAAIYGDFRIFGKINVNYMPPIYIPPKADGTPYSKEECASLAKELLDNIYASIPEDYRESHKG